MRKLNHEKFMGIIDRLLKYGFKLNMRPNWDLKKALNYHLASKNIYILVEYLPYISEDGEIIEKFDIKTYYILYKTHQETKLFELDPINNDIKNIRAKLKRRIKRQRKNESTKNI